MKKWLGYPDKYEIEVSVELNPFKGWMEGKKQLIPVCDRDVIKYNWTKQGISFSKEFINQLYPNLQLNLISNRESNE